MRVRTVERADFPACLDLFTRVAEEGRWIATEAPVDRREVRLRWEALIRGGEGALLLAEEGEGALPEGLAALVGRARPELGMLVAPGSRRRGVGSALLAACIEWARAAGAPELVLHVFPHNQAALALYRKHGFEEQGRILRAYPRRSGERWDAIRMVRATGACPIPPEREGARGPP
jgi:ribosomal protein S18 acetylase RimI-like enzyme